MATITLTGEDFDDLASNSQDLRTGRPEDPDDWPQVDDYGKPFAVERWDFLYSFDRTALVLARAFLRDEGVEFQIIVTGDEGPDCWLIFTSYMSPSWRASRAQRN